jgi:hypothetical protein
MCRSERRLPVKVAPYAAPGIAPLTRNGTTVPTCSEARMTTSRARDLAAGDDDIL